jgi:hypothetical protein
LVKPYQFYVDNIAFVNVEPVVKAQPNYPPSIAIPAPMSSYQQQQGAATLAPGATTQAVAGGTSRPVTPYCKAGSAGCQCAGGPACDEGLLCQHGTCLAASCDIYRQAGCECGSGRVCADGGRCDGGALLCHGSFDASDACGVGEPGCDCNGGTCNDPALSCVAGKCRRSDCKPGTLSCRCTDASACLRADSFCATLPAGQFCVARPPDDDSAAASSLPRTLVVAALLPLLVYLLC